MSSKTCPQCGQPANGNFCSVCGAGIGALFCNQCGTEAEPGSRFCNQCGSALAQGATPPAPVAGIPPAAPSGNRLLWWVAGGALVGLILIVAYPVIQGGRGAPAGVTPSASGGMPGSGPSSLDLASMTPREAADRLFNRVMIAMEAGDSTEAMGFLPMAISAYEIAEPLNADGLYHLATLKQTARDFEGALAAALAGLEDNPDHLLNLIAAARAAHSLGDDQGARDRYARLLAVWDDQMASGIADYQDHSGQIPELKAEAEAFLEP